MSEEDDDWTQPIWKRKPILLWINIIPIATLITSGLVAIIGGYNALGIALSILILSTSLACLTAIISAIIYTRDQKQGPLQGMIYCLAGLIAHGAIFGFIFGACAIVASL